jgi:hypothetical protein
METVKAVGERDQRTLLDILIAYICGCELPSWNLPDEPCKPDFISYLPR